MSCRSIEIEKLIEAPPEAVWQALTDPEELTRWFPLEARVEPGEGGAIALSWGPEAEGENRILVWEPGRRLRTGWFAATGRFGREPRMHSPTCREDPDTASRLVVDLRLEGRRGTTVLRLVHSGFSADAAWDEEFEAHRRGWAFELDSLRTYLEHHRGQDRRVVHVTAPVHGERQAAWAELMSPAGVGEVAGLAEGARYALTLPDGQRLQGTVIANRPPDEFAATVENLGHALLRAGVEACWGVPTALVWLSTWGEHRDAAGALERQWQGTLARLFPQEGAAQSP